MAALPGPAGVLVPAVLCRITLLPTVDGESLAMTATMHGDESVPKTLLGLPCARCRAYYAVGIHACPVCGCIEKISTDGASKREFEVSLLTGSAVQSEGFCEAEV